MSDFQSVVNHDLPYGVEGDFSSINPYYTVQNPAGGSFRAGDEDGISIGRFAWVDLTTGLATHTKGSLKIGGFVGRYNQAVIFTRIDGSLVVPQARGVSLYRGGDFWARFTAGATAGQIVAANTTTGVLTAVDAVADGVVDTGFVVATSCGANELAKINGSK